MGELGLCFVMESLRGITATNTPVTYCHFLPRGRAFICMKNYYKTLARPDIRIRIRRRVIRIRISETRISTIIRITAPNQGHRQTACKNQQKNFAPQISKKFFPPYGGIEFFSVFRSSFQLDIFRVPCSVHRDPCFGK